MKGKITSFLRKIKKIDLSNLLLSTKLNLQRHPKETIIGATLAFFVLVNLLFTFLPLRLDFSPGHAYSLAPATKKVIAKLDSKVTLQLYISSDLPIRLLPLKTDIIDLVREYDRQGGSKISIELLDPKKDADAKKSAQELGLPELQFSQIENDKYAVTASYLAIVIKQGQKIAVIPQAVNPETLEYDITAALYKMTQKQDLVIGLAGMEAGNDPQVDQWRSVRNVLSQQFSVQTVSVASDSAQKAIDPSIKTLIVVGSEIYNEDSLKGLTDFINKGGAALFMVDGVMVENDLQATVKESGLFSLFSQFGITLNKDLVLSESAEIANFSTNQGSFFTPYPFWVKSDVLARNRPEFANVNVLVFPWVSSLGVVADVKNTAVLVHSPQNSWQQTTPFVLLPNAIPSPKPGQIKSFDLVVEKKVGKGTITVIPSARFVNEQFLSNKADNLEFVINLISKYASGGALSGIRSRSVSVAPLQTIEEGNKDTIKYVTVLILPLILAFFGAVRLKKRQ